MTTQTHRDLYALSIASRGASTLERLKTARATAAKMPYAKRAGKYDGDPDGLLEQRVLQLRALVELARMAGKDPITVAVSDIANLVFLDDLAQDMEEAIHQAEHS